MRLLIAALAAFTLSAAAEAPRPPCAGMTAIPAHTKPGAAPSVSLLAKEEAASWTPPACLRWPTTPSKLIVAVAGSFRHDGDADALLARFGAISTLRGLPYWSVTDNTWRVLITDAAALSGPDTNRRRADFTAAELKGGSDVFFVQDDSRSSGSVVYRLRTLEASADRLVVETENVSPVQAFLLTLFPPGSLRATYFLERRPPGLWFFYGLSSTGAQASALATVSEASYVNRAAALYSHVTGVAEVRLP